MEHLFNAITATMLIVVLLLGVFVAGFIVFGTKYFCREDRKNKTCEWKNHSGENSDDCTGLYDTSCKEVFYDATESGTPVSDWAKYCPYCGRSIKAT